MTRLLNILFKERKKGIKTMMSRSCFLFLCAPRKSCVNINMDAHCVNLHCARWSAHFSVDVFFFPPSSLLCLSSLFWRREFKKTTHTHRHARRHTRTHINTQGWRFARMLAEERFGTTYWIASRFPIRFRADQQLHAEPPRYGACLS